jgi:hypothetical protein
LLKIKFVLTQGNFIEGEIFCQEEKVHMGNPSEGVKKFDYDCNGSDKS